MRRTLFVLAMALACVGLTAQNRVVVYEDGEGYAFGLFNRVSDNGKWAVGCDDYFQTGSYIVDVERPETLNVISGGVLYDVSDDGMAVGAWYENMGTPLEPAYACRAAYYKDGGWVRLTLPLETSGQSYARCVSADGKYIGGMIFCTAKDSEIGGKHYPCIWTYNDATEEYDLTCFNRMQLPGNMGFTVNDMSNDGSLIVGAIFTDAGGMVPAMVRDGKPVFWNKMEWKDWPYEIGGETMYLPTGFVDGIAEGTTAENWFDGAFYYINGDCVFGHRSVASNVDVEKATGDVTHNRCIYNVRTDQFTDEPSATAFSAGFDERHAFLVSGTTGYYLNDGAMRKINKSFDITSPVDVAAVYGFDCTYRVFACSIIWESELLGGLVESPALMLLEKPGYDGIDNILSQPFTVESYNLRGERVSGHNVKGIRIVGGRKIVGR